jgi:hypothetical protein
MYQLPLNDPGALGYEPAVLELMRALRDRQHILDELSLEVTERLQASPRGMVRAEDLALFYAQQALARQMVATLRERQALLRRYLEPLQRHLEELGVAGRPEGSATDRDSLLQAAGVGGASGRGQAELAASAIAGPCLPRGT